MRARISHSWRALRTGLAFVIFGVVAFSLGAVILPIAHRLAGLLGRQQRAEDRAQYYIHLAYRFHAWCMKSLGLLSVKCIGAERLRGEGPHLLVANHPTLIDVVLIVSMLPQADCIVEISWANNFFMRHAVRAAGYICNDSGVSVIEESARRLRAGRTLLVFPEGTRSPERSLGPFRRGAAHAALASGCDILPLVVTCEPPTLMKGQKWYHVPDRAFEVTIRVEEPISVKEYLDRGETAVLAARKLNAALRETIVKRLDLAEP